MKEKTVWERMRGGKKEAEVKVERREKGREGEGKFVRFNFFFLFFLLS